MAVCPHPAAIQLKNKLTKKTKAPSGRELSATQTEGACVRRRNLSSEKGAVGVQSLNLHFERKLKINK